jgi:hypothetical protein
MTDKTIDLDQHRGMAAQKATELRRLLAGVEANEKELRVRQDELEAHFPTKADEQKLTKNCRCRVQSG